MAQIVFLPDKGRTKLLAKIKSFLAPPPVSWKTCVSLRDSLQNVSLVNRDDNPHLLRLSSFISRFKDDVAVQIPPSVRQDMLRWQGFLSKSSESLTSFRLIDPDIWVDASTTWGIGIVVGNAWAAWQLKPGWNADGRDNIWAESLALELAVMWIVTSGIHDAHVFVRGDNTGVIGAFNKSHSRSTLNNDSIRRINLLLPFHLSIEPVYVASGNNRADPISRGILGPSEQRLKTNFQLPDELVPFLSYV